MGKNDLYFLLRFILSTSTWPHPEKPGELLFDDEFYFYRCREVQFGPECLDIWFRGSGKSTVKTFGRTIQRILNNPNRTFGIFSLTKTIADAFLFQIKQELESNEFLVNLYPDVLWANPNSESPSWSLLKGITVKQTMNVKDPTVSAWGLVDSNFTSKRFSDRVYDDVINESSVTSPEMMQKATDAWDHSLDTGMPGTVDCYCGTFYAYGDTYYHIAQRGVAPLRLHPCYHVLEDDSEYDSQGLPVKVKFDRDRPILFSGEYFKHLEKSKSPQIFASQYLCNPVSGASTSFDVDTIHYYEATPQEMRRGKAVYFLVDPASDRKKGRSYFVLWVVGLGADHNYYILDCVWERLNLDQRSNVIFRKHAQWKPLEVRYEQYAFQMDTEHLRHLMSQRGYHFPITEVGGNVPKADRINRLQPLFQEERVYFPLTLPYFDQAGEEYDLVSIFKTNEFIPWPHAAQNDMLDALSRIAEPDLMLRWPKSVDFLDDADPDRYRQKLRDQRRKSRLSSVSWMGA